MVNERRNMNGTLRATSALAVLLAVGVSTVRAQSVPEVKAAPLTLHAALERAEANAYANRIAAGTAAAQTAQAAGALKGILPSVRVEGGWVRTTDPIGAFGTALRQRRIAQQDFDPARLNYPAAATNYVGALVVEQPLLNADAYLGRRAATRAGDAAASSAQWTRVGTRLDVIRAYYGAVLAAEKAATLGVAERAATRHVDQAESAVRAGLVTPSDALLARVRAGEVEAQLIEARGDAALALRQLAVVMGTPGDSALQLPAQLPTATRIRAMIDAGPATTAGGGRADVSAARLADDAARADVARARAAFLPRLNGFARYDWNSATTPYAGDENWTVGVMATWTPFAGASQWADQRAASGRADAAHAARAAAEAQAMLDVERAENARRVALARLEIAERGARQSAEAHRIVTKKYEGGLATVTELLDAAAVETQSGLSLTHARWAAIVAEAERRRALGHDPAGIADYLTTENIGAER
jgi:outer membrane protein TolC